ncbi:MAG: ATP-binding cassette domain-containing protein [Xanthomonadaceae bacterium]|nr:ATP-binding cassette domain-containing protein [Xanthomonadaceae bacterium]
MNIRFESVYKSFGPKKPLNGITFEIPHGKNLFILGKSGTGKSVLLKHAVGLMMPDEGRISVDGKSTSDMNREEIIQLRKKCGIIFQNPALFDFLNIEENIAFGVEDHSGVDELLRLMDLPLDIKRKKPREISFGMQKRVAIARTLATKPDVLLFDEPTTGLDPTSRDAVNDWIDHLHEKLGVTQVVVSHDMVSAKRLAHEVIILDQGKIVAQGAWDVIQSSPHPIVKDFMRAGFL